MDKEDKYTKIAKEAKAIFDLYKVDQEYFWLSDFDNQKIFDCNNDNKNITTSITLNTL